MIYIDILSSNDQS